MCSAVCTRRAISICLDDEGFYKPFVDAEKCIDCGYCTKVCSKFDDDFKLTTKNQLESVVLYAASAKDDDVVRNTTSGGIADLLAHQLYKDGYRVIGVVYDKKRNNAVHCMAEKEYDINLFRGSKYIQPYSADAFRALVENCRNENYAVFGLPCQIYAISRYINRINKRDNHILVDLYCHGCPSMKIWKKVSDDIMHKNDVASFDNVIWRSKLRGWGAFVLEVQKDDKRIYNSSPLHNEFFDLFFSNQLLNESCSTCKHRSTLEYTDIRLGDFWGPDFRKDIYGMSGVSVVTERGHKLFNKISNLIDFKVMPTSSFFPYQSWGHEYKIDNILRKKLMNGLKDDNLTPAHVVDLLPSHHTVSYKVKTFIKLIFCYLPKGLSTIIRNF